uniref:Cytochrome c oxidase subunit 2 n=1 Tax=Plagiorhynchus transversus TaxID=1795586 RepID=A0A140E9N3_9BILA|nr:cytochrome c oxidase subunit II [Plagiorhynchus transversus]AMK97084.1 cytochrome c oxidase subunit 2 [Plagiorhynchus transversus]
MIHWGLSSMADGISMFMEGVIQFNDYVMSLSGFIFWFVVILVILECLGGAKGGEREAGGVFVLEFVWTFLPMLLLVFMAYPSMLLLYMSDVSEEADLFISVVGHQWFWEYKSLGGGGEMSYMEDFKEGGYRLLDVDNRLTLPLMGSLVLNLTSEDVIHSWAVPSLGVKMDCVPGRLNQLGVEVVTPGVYYGQCSELCGILHSFMPIVVEVVGEEDFMQ